MMEYFRKEGKIHITFQREDLELANNIISEAIFQYEQSGYEISDTQDAFEEAIEDDTELCLTFDFKNRELGIGILEAIVEGQEERGIDTSYVQGFLKRVNYFRSELLH